MTKVENWLSLKNEIIQRELTNTWTYFARFSLNTFVEHNSNIREESKKEINITDKHVGEIN